MLFFLFWLFNSLSRYFFRFPLYHFLLSLTNASFIFKGPVSSLCWHLNRDMLWAVQAVLLDTVCGQCCTGRHSAVPSKITFNFLSLQEVQLRFPANPRVLLRYGDTLHSLAVRDIGTKADLWRFFFLFFLSWKQGHRLRFFSDVLSLIMRSVHSPLTSDLALWEVN